MCKLSFRASETSSKTGLQVQIGTGFAIPQTTRGTPAKIEASHVPVPEPQLQNSQAPRAIGFSRKAGAKWLIGTFRNGNALRHQVSEMSHGLKRSTLPVYVNLRAPILLGAPRISTDLKARLACLLRSSAHLLAVATFLVASALPLLADTPSLLRRVPTGGCYCHCAESKAHRACVKMCESKKYGSRWWATTCAKPHMSTPRRDSHAGPRFPHPRRTEHARL